MASPYYVYSGATGAANGSSWTDAYTSLDNLFTGQAITNGDIIYIASDHDNGSYAANKTFTSPETTYETPGDHIYLISTNRTSNLPEVGAIEQSGGNYSLSLYGRWWIYGVTFKAGSGTSQSSAYIYLGSTSLYNYGGRLYCCKCTFNINSTNAGSRLYLDRSLYDSEYTCLEQCTFITSSTTYTRLSGYIELIDCDGTGLSTSTALFSVNNSVAFTEVHVTGCKFPTSNYLTSNTEYGFWFYARNSILPGSIESATSTVHGANIIELHSCGSGDHNYYYLKFDKTGTTESNVSVYLTTGAPTCKDNDGTEVPYSLKMSSNAQTYNCSKANPQYSPWIHVPCFSTGSKTFSVKVAHTEAAVLKDNETWLEIEYMGGAAASNTPITAREHTAPVISGTTILDILATGSNLTDTSEAWTGISSEKTHTLSKTVTIDEQGYARVRVAFTKANSVLYVNPDVTVS